MSLKLFPQFEDVRALILILREMVLKTDHKVVGKGMIHAIHEYKPIKYLNAAHIDLHSIGFMDLINRFVYPRINAKTKFNLVYTFQKDDDLRYYPKTTLPCTINFTYEDGSPLPMEIVYREIHNVVSQYAERDTYGDIISVSIEAYSLDIKDSRDVVTLSIEESNKQLEELAMRLDALNNLRNNSRFHLSKKKNPHKAADGKEHPPPRGC